MCCSRVFDFERARRDATLAGRPLTAHDVRQLYDRHGPALTLYARFYVTDFSAAEDVVHSVFLKLLEVTRTMPERPAAYLYRAVKNAALNVRRRHSRELPVPLNDLWFTDDSLDPEAVLAVQKALGELSEEQKEAVVMRVWGGMTFEEIAESTGVSINTIASRYRYGLNKLREKLQARFPTGEKDTHGS